MEISLVKAFNWSLYELDLTDIESLFPFIFRLTSGDGIGSQTAYCDQVDWL